MEGKLKGRVTYRITLKTLLFDSRYNLIGIKSGTTCYCGDDYTVTPNSGACTSMCTGDGVSECGSSTKYSIYNITNTQVVQSKKMFKIPYLFDFEEVPHLETRSYHIYMVKFSFFVLSNPKKFQKADDIWQTTSIPKSRLTRISQFASV